MIKDYLAIALAAAQILTGATTANPSISPAESRDNRELVNITVGIESREETPFIDVTRDTDACRDYMITVCGEALDEDLYDYLRSELQNNGIGWWLKYAIAQAFTESSFNPYAENPNGKDKGLFQYRLEYWPAVSAQYGISGANIFDAKAQIHVYAQQMAERLNRGESIYLAINRHKMSDYVDIYDEEYVVRVLDNVLQEGGIVKWN